MLANKRKKKIPQSRKLILESQRALCKLNLLSLLLTESFFNPLETRLNFFFPPGQEGWGRGFEFLLYFNG